EDRSSAVSMRWSQGDEIYLLGEPGWEPSSLAGSEHAWWRGERGGRPNPHAEAAGRLVRLRPALAEHRLVSGAHHLSIGGLALALARMAIASGCGARIELPEDASRWPSATLYGEAAGRAVLAVLPQDAARLEGTCASVGVHAVRLGEARGSELSIRIGGHLELRIEMGRLSEAWECAF